MNSSSLKAHASDWDSLSAIDIQGGPTKKSDHSIVFETEAGPLCIEMLSFGFRIRLGNRIAYDYKMLGTAPKAQECEVIYLQQGWSIESGPYSLHIHPTPFQFNLLKHGKPCLNSTQDGHFVRELRVPPLAITAEGWLINFALKEQEPLYGLGEKWGPLNKRGQFIRSCNHDALGVNAEISYKNAPFLWSPNGWGVLVHTPASVSHAVGYAPWSHRNYGVLVEDNALDMFVLAQENSAELLSLYQTIMGSAPLPPNWSLGLILSKAYYKDANELLTVARRVREQRLPCDVITLDGRAWQDTDTRFKFAWDHRYPEPQKVIDELKALNFHICLWEYPLVSVKGPLYEMMAKKGWLLKDRRNGKPFRYKWDQSAFGNVLTPLPDSGLVDFTHPDAYAFWRDSHEPLFKAGITMIKADFGEQVEDDNMLAANGETGAQLRNVYSLLYNRCVYEAAEKFSQSNPFLFSRSGWLGSHKYPSQWGGDPQADWQGLAASIRGGLSWGLTGSPYYATDVGGFFKDQRDPLLYVRWCQAAVFSAHMRLHGIGDREPWSYGEPASTAAIEAIKLRYALLPYIQKSMMFSQKTGQPLQRAMVLAFPDQPESWSFELQFMFGEDMLVVPCVSDDNQVRFYLPKGQWRRFLTDEYYTGGQFYQKSLKLEEMAVFVKNQARIPMLNVREHIDSAQDLSQADYTWPSVNPSDKSKENEH